MQNAKCSIIHAIKYNEPMNLITLLAACLTVDAGCIRYRDNIFMHRDQSGSKLSGGTCYNISIYIRVKCPLQLYR